MLWQTWIDNAASALGLTSTQTGVVISLIITSAILMIFVIATRGKEAGTTLPVIGVVCVIFFTFLEWIPIWTGSAIGFFMALWVAKKIGDAVS